MYCAPWSAGWHWGGWLFPGLPFLILVGIGLWLILRCAPGRSPASPRCSRCGGAIQEVYFRCPHCGETLKRNCSSCSRVVEHGWIYCPYCSKELDPQGAASPS